MEDIIGSAEDILQPPTGNVGPTKLVVGDHDQAVHMGGQLLNPLLRLRGTAASLKLERLGDNGHRQGPGFPGQLGHHGGGAGSCSTPHARCDEHQVGPLHDLLDLRSGLLGRLLAGGRVASRTQTLGEPLTKLKTILRR